MTSAAFPIPDCCVYVPSKDGSAGGQLFELEASPVFITGGFVVIPYRNPAREKVEPLFFKVIRSLPFLPEVQKSSGQVKLQAGLSREEYLEKVKELKNQIQFGNIYEINFCMQFFFQEADIDPFSVFDRLYRLSQAPYSFLVKLKDEYILSSSPELFLKKTGNTLETKPIKGTLRRGRDKKEDEQLRETLHKSLKDRTENVMAVDVARNDLSHFAAKGSVKVNKLYNIETFETVHQMVSTVSCELKPGVTFETILNSCFPMASMTGAPKQRAMQLIDTHENFERNYYSGAMGFVDAKGDYTLSVVIRSIFYNMHTHFLSLAVGGAITYLSTPEEEYAECLLKAKALFSALEIGDTKA